MRDRSYIFDASYLQPEITETSNRRLSSNARSFHEHVHFLKTVVHSFLSRGFSGGLGSVRSRLFRTPKPESSGTGPAQGVSTYIGDRDDCIVKGSLYVDVPLRY